MCFFSQPKFPKIEQPAAEVPNPNAAADAAAQAEIARRRAAMGFGSTIGASTMGGPGPSLASKTLFGQ